MVATQIRTRLAECGHRSVFFDFDPADGIPAGRDWEKELYAQLQDCRAVIVLCSQASVESRWCFAEITPADSILTQVLVQKLIKVWQHWQAMERGAATPWELNSRHSRPQ